MSEKPDPLAGVREAVHQAPGPSSFVRTIKSVPDWDGLRGAEKIQVELTRPDATEAGHEPSPAPEDEPPAAPKEDPTIGEDTNSHSYLRPGPGQCSNCLEFSLSGESHPVPCRRPITCHNCRLPGHRVAQCPQLTMPGYPEPYMRPPFCYSCMKPGHTVGTCPELSANEESKPADATARRRRKRRNRGLATTLGPRALRLLEQGPAVQPLQIRRLELTPQLNAEGDVSND